METNEETEHDHQILIIVDIYPGVSEDALESICLISENDNNRQKKNGAKGKCASVKLRSSKSKP